LKTRARADLDATCSFCHRANSCETVKEKPDSMPWIVTGHSNRSLVIQKQSFRKSNEQTPPLATLMCDATASNLLKQRIAEL
jgi:cytochrome c553